MHQHILVNLMLFLYKLIKDTCEKKRHQFDFTCPNINQANYVNINNKKKQN